MGSLFLYFSRLSLKACVIIPVIIIIRQLLKKQPKIYSYLLWIGVFATLAADISLPAVKIKTPVSAAQQQVLNSYYEVLADYTEETSVYHHNTLEYYTAVKRGIQPVYNQENGRQYVVTAKDTVKPAKTRLNNMAVYSGIWLSGVAILCFLFIKSSLEICSKTRFAVHCRDNIWLLENAGSPFVFGFAKPKIYIPENLAVKDLSYITAHEQTHINRKDYIIKPLCLFITILHWFNPLVWLAYKLMCRDMEMSCDEAVIDTFGKDSKKIYSMLLVDFAEDKSLTATVLFGESKAESRVKNILRFKKPKAVMAAALACAVVLSVALPFISKPWENIINKINPPETLYEKLEKLNSLENVEYTRRMSVADGTLTPFARWGVTFDDKKPIYDMPAFRQNDPTVKFDISDSDLIGYYRVAGKRIDDGNKSTYSVLEQVGSTSFEIYDFADNWQLKHTINLPQEYIRASIVSHDKINRNHYITCINATDTTGRPYLLTIHITGGTEKINAVEITEINENYYFQQFSLPHSIMFLNENVGFASHRSSSDRLSTYPRNNPFDIYPKAFITTDGGESWQEIDFSALVPEDRLFNRCAGETVLIYGDTIEIRYYVPANDLPGNGAGDGYALISFDRGLTWAGYYRYWAADENGNDILEYKRITDYHPVIYKQPPQGIEPDTTNMTLGEKLALVNSIDHLQYKYRIGAETAALYNYAVPTGWVDGERLFPGAWNTADYPDGLPAEYNVPPIPVEDQKLLDNLSYNSCTGVRIDDNGAPEYSMCVYENDTYTIWDYKQSTSKWQNWYLFPEKVGIYKLQDLKSHNKIANNYYITNFTGETDDGAQYLLTVHTINGKSIVNPYLMDNLSHSGTLQTRGTRFLNESVGISSVYTGSADPAVYITIDGGKNWQQLDFTDVIPQDMYSVYFTPCIVATYGKTIEIRCHAKTETRNTHLPDNFAFISFDGGLNWAAYSRTPMSTAEESDDRSGYLYTQLGQTMPVKPVEN